MILLSMLAMAAAEATLAALALTLLGVSGVWATLTGAAVAGALAERLAGAWLPDHWQRRALLLPGLLCALAATGVAGGPAALAPGGPQSGQAYLVALGALYAFWRGTALPGRDTAAAQGWFGRITLALLGVVCVGLLLGARPGSTAVAQVIVCFAAGLAALALAQLLDAELAAGFGWRGGLTVAASIGLVLLAGLTIGAFAGGQLGAALRTVGGWLSLLLALIVVPLAALLVGGLEWALRAAGIDQLEPLRQLQAEQERQRVVIDQGLVGLPPWLAAAVQLTLALLPALLLLALLLRRRLRPRASPADEERVSLLTGAAVVADLRALLGELRSPFAPHGLRAALAALRGGDPSSRVRRSYVRLLLLGEERGSPREPAQTPHEYRPRAPGAPEPTDRLTAAYERARYDPAGASEADATAAEAAWEEIRRAR